MLYDIYGQLPKIHTILASYDAKHANQLHELYTDELAVHEDSFSCGEVVESLAYFLASCAQRVIDEFSDLQRLIEGCINLEAAQRDEYQINVTFDPEFSRWCEEKEQVKKKIETLYRTVPWSPASSASDHHV